MKNKEQKIKLNLGKVVITTGALTFARGSYDCAGLVPAELIEKILNRHRNGDWGDISEEEKRNNEIALETGERIISVYKINDYTKIWVITEGDRSTTTVLLADEY
jgi:hypothetical protein